MTLLWALNSALEMGIINPTQVLTTNATLAANTISFAYRIYRINLGVTLTIASGAIFRIL